MPQWTEEQLRAIEARGSHVLLSAAAGSGKTTVLVERVIRLITQAGAQVDRMLVVTFTRAAASDMRLKLFRALSDRAARGDVNCRGQLMKLDQAGISTLHAFCADFLRTNFEAAGVDPAFRILDDALVARLRGEALDEALELFYAGGREDGEAPEYRPDGAMLKLDYGRGPRGVRAAAEALLAQLEDRPDGEAWLEAAGRCDEAQLSLWQEELKGAARRSIDGAIVQLREAIDMVGCPPQYAEAMENDLQRLSEMRALQDYDSLYRALSEYKPTRVRSVRGSGGSDEVKAIQSLRRGAANILESAAILKLPLTTARADARALAGQIRTLSAIALKAAQIFEEKKAQRAGLTYSDLEHRTLRALRDPAVASLMRAKYDYIFVDEYQDTSDLQEAVVSAIGRSDNLFMVGDVKQSIYRFRHAEPRLFLEKYAAYGAGQGGMLLPLTRNFRSRRGILDFVNLIFERAMTGGDSEITYDALARLNPGRGDAEAGGPCVDIRLVDMAGEAEDRSEGSEEADEVLSEVRDIEAEGLLIARTIREMMGEDPDLRYRDIAILTRAKSHTFSAMMSALLAMGIPAYADGATGYFDSVEVHWALNLLKLVDNRRLDIPLIGVLRSAAVGLTADQLSRIRIACPGGAYCDAVRQYADQYTDHIARRLQAFFAHLERWCLQRDVVPLGELLRIMLQESGFYAYVGALPGGAQRQANLDQLVATAGSFDREISGSLHRFIAYTEHLRARGDGDAAHLLGEGEDVVRMMTVHKSKGLEFKVVFGANLNRRYHRERTSAPLVAHRSLGVGLSYVDEELRARRVTLPQVAIMERQRREDSAEELRILYVLMTRARERLILTGSEKRVAAARLRWMALSDRPFAANTHMDVVMAARTGAELEGEELHSTFEVVALQALREGLPVERQSPARQLMAAIAEHPGDYEVPAFSRELNWRYPAPEGARNPMKLTASGLIRELEGPGEVPTLQDRPAFMQAEAAQMTGAERGTAYHRGMQLMDLRSLGDLTGPALIEAVEDQLNDFARRRLMTPAQREAVRASVLAQFLQGPMGLRLRRARTVRREWPFNVRLKVSEALTAGESDRFDPQVPLLVQGTIDCCFIEEGQWVLLDYKTDRETDLEALRDHYRHQLHLYAAALERITHIPVRERTLCLIAQGRTLEV